MRRRHVDVIKDGGDRWGAVLSLCVSERSRLQIFWNKGRAISIQKGQGPSRSFCSLFSTHGMIVRYESPYERPSHLVASLQGVDSGGGGRRSNAWP